MSQLAYIFIGPPGSGKGSLSKLCIEQLGWIQLSTGDLCRKHIQRQTEIGKQIDFIIKSGKLISDELITDMVDQWLDEVAQDQNSLILDGFPRTIVQAENLCNLVKNKYPSLKIQVIRFIISDEAAINRICNRFICQNSECQAIYSGNANSGLCASMAMICNKCSNPLGRRKDDSQEVIQNRLNTYRKHEDNMIDFYKAINNSILEFDVEKPLQEVFETFKESVIKKEV